MNEAPYFTAEEVLAIAELQFDAPLDQDNPEAHNQINAIRERFLNRLKERLPEDFTEEDTYRNDDLKAAFNIAIEAAYEAICKFHEPELERIRIEDLVEGEEEVPFDE